MKISQYIEQLEGWDSDDREKYLRPLLAVFSPVSLTSLQQVQQEHFPKSEMDYPAFVKSQNREILKCLTLEMASIGAVVRAVLGLEPLTEDTEVEIPSVALAVVESEASDAK